MQAFFISRTRFVKKPGKFFVSGEDPKLYQFAPLYLNNVSNTEHAKSALLEMVKSLQNIYQNDSVSIKARGKYIRTTTNIDQTVAQVETEHAVFSLKLSSVDIDSPESRQGV